VLYKRYPFPHGKAMKMQLKTAEGFLFNKEQQRRYLEKNSGRDVTKDRKHTATLLLFWFRRLSM